MKRAALYVRVSTQEQKNHGLSVDNQIDALREYCNTNGLIEAGLYNDAGISARKKYTKRPALLQLINDCKAGKVDIILFTKLDRWFRSVGDYYEVQRELDASGVPWRAIWEDYETETSSGVFKVNIMLSVAQSEADRTSERIRAVFDYRKAQGLYFGHAPLGYVVVKGRLIKNKELEDSVNKLFDYYASTLSIVNTLRYCNDTLGLKLTRDSLRHILKTEAYYGLALGYHECEPYITKAQFDINTRSIEARKQKQATQSYETPIFTGLLRCGHCGKAYTFSATSTVINGTRRRYIYYRCRHRDTKECTNSHAMSERLLEKFLLNNIEEEMSAYVDKVKSNTKSVDTNKKIKALESKLSRIGIRFEDGDITVEEYRTKRADILIEIDSLKAQAPETIPEPLPDNWKEVYASLDNAHKKVFWQSIIKYVTIYNPKAKDIRITF